MLPELRILHREAPSSPRPAAFELVARLGSFEVATVTGWRLDGDSYRIEDLYVQPDHRRCGLGLVLVGALAEVVLRRHGTRLLVVSADDGSGRLTAWYSTLGFTRRGLDEEGRPVLEGSARRVLALAKSRSAMVRSQLEPEVAHGPEKQKREVAEL